MLVEVIEGEWIQADEITNVSYHEVEQAGIWVVLIKIRGCEYSKRFKSEESARGYCFNLVEKINKVGGE